jgi:hypothetical protein
MNMYYKTDHHVIRLVVVVVMVIMAAVFGEWLRWRWQQWVACGGSSGWVGAVVFSDGLGGWLVGWLEGG